ncbi:MAG: hypothetical protein AAFQ87_25240 [Bacteroidota bacterium]
MRFLLRILLIAVLSYWAQLYLPFWIAAVIAFVVGVLLSRQRQRRSFGRNKQGPSYSFLAGFIALALLWGGMAFYLDHENASLLSSKLSQYLLKADEGFMSGPYPMIAMSALIGGLIGGFSTMTGNLFGMAIKS